MVVPVVESVSIAAPPEAVYDLVADVSRMGEWSPEATGARGASSSPQEGDTFVGWNRRGIFRWFTNCTVRRAQRGQRFEFDVDFGPLPVSRWIYEFTIDGEATRVTETWIDRREGPGGAVVKAFGQVLIPGNRPEHNRANMIRTLRTLKRVAEDAHASDR